jgi:hypothetical protein
MAARNVAEPSSLWSLLRKAQSVLPTGLPWWRARTGIALLLNTRYVIDP